MRYIAIMLLLCAVSASAELTHKYTIATGQAMAEDMPVAGDIDGDGRTELVTVIKNHLLVYDGHSGRLEWSKSDAYWKAAELADLNHDGTPEVLYTSSGPRVKALYGNGSAMWSTRTRGDGQPMFPLLVADGYVYFATEDTSPTPYNGDMRSYRGAVTKLDYRGNIKGYYWVEHPCWGGMSYYNGTLFIGDRRKGYAGFPSKGIQAIDTMAMTEKWSRPEMQHSSNIPIVTDHDGDGDMEIIATPLNTGAVVLDIETGRKIRDYSDRSTASHGTATVYDIDGDGHAEIAQASSYPDTITPKVTVTDLVTGKVEMDVHYSSPSAWPPKFGDIDADGDMEILIGWGLQNTGGTYPVMIFGKDYKPEVTLDLGRAGQIYPIRMYDLDDDGLLELVIPTASGKIFVYNTPTNYTGFDQGRQFYGNERTGAAI